MASPKVESHSGWSVEAVADADADDLSVCGSAVSGKLEGHFQRGTGGISVMMFPCDHPHETHLSLLPLLSRGFDSIATLDDVCFQADGP